MSKLTSAEQIRILADQYAAMVEAANVLESLGSLDQATAEAQAALLTLATQRDQATTDIASLKNTLDQLTQAAADTVANATKQAQGILDKASADAENRVSASISAAKATASAQADAILSAAEARASAAADSYAATMAMSEKAAANLESVTADLAAKQAQYDTLSSALDSLKAKLG